MGTFRESSWANDQFSGTYLERADIYIQERSNLLDVASSYFTHFYGGKRRVSLLDLGCGDGILTRKLMNLNDAIEATLVDGSETMLEKARGGLGTCRSAQFVKGSFQEIVDGKIGLGEFDFCVSSMAIHHLDLQEKPRLFHYVYAHLRKGGRFLNVDVILAPSRELKEWYHAKWKEWMSGMIERLKVTDETAEEIVTRYESPLSMNKPDTLEDQIAALRAAGYLDVDCFYKNGIFAVFGGKKEP